MNKKFINAFIFVLCANTAMARSVTLCVNPDILNTSVTNWTIGMGINANSGSGYINFKARVTINDGANYFTYTNVLIDSRCGKVLDTEVHNKAFNEDDFLNDAHTGNSYCFCKMVRPFVTPYFAATYGPQTSFPYDSCVNNCAYYCAHTVPRDGFPNFILNQLSIMPNFGTDYISTDAVTRGQCPTNYLPIEKDGVGFETDCTDTGGTVYTNSVFDYATAVTSCFSSDLVPGEPCAMFYWGGYEGSDASGYFSIKSKICNEFPAEGLF